MQPTEQPPFIAYLHGFRGIAILAIMGAHAWSTFGHLSGVQDSNPQYIWLYAATESLFHGTTLFFALISGVLVTRVLRGTPWKKFFRNKFANVILPYMVVSTLFTALAWPEILAYIKAHGLHYSFSIVLLWNIVSGQAAVHLWYIPVLAVLYLLTPFLTLLLKPGRGIVLLALAAAPLVVSRTVSPDFLSFKTIVYFLGAYAFGMYLGQRLEAMLVFCKAWRFELLVLFVLSLAVNFLLFRWEYVPGGFVSLQQTVVYLNKLSAALLLLQLLHNNEQRLPTLLQTLGTYAFSLYFLHFTIFGQLATVFCKLDPQPSIAAVAAGGLAIYLLGICVALLLSMGVHRLLGRYSRMVIGA